MTIFHAEKCCYLMSAQAVSNGCLLATMSTVPDP